MLLNEAIMTRHSTRLFLPTPVPHSLLEHALEVATYSPSNSNTQAWRLFVVTGSALTRLTSTLVHSASQGEEPNIPGLPAAFNTYRSALGKQVYGEGYGLARDDIEGRKAATLRNFDFFGAPVGIVVCMSSELVETEALSVGMYVQTLLLALTERGLASCVEISIAGYPDLVKREVGIPEDLMVLCGIAVGYEDGDAGVNKIRSKREVVDKTTVWVGE
ncbi:oxidoreductase [Xylariaceae sp. AK1471]|nr:oxidoreductase [Xylariaceae sp. AK1471]